MSFVAEIKEAIKPYHLLSNWFYIAWSEGKLNTDVLGKYAKQYYPIEKNLQTCLRELAKHGQGEEVILSNLADEQTHPQLWCQFGEALGVKQDEMINATPNPETADLIQVFLSSCTSSFAEGIATVFAYEYQVPEVAQSKLDGLKKFYGIENEHDTEFFHVHKKADEWHSQELAKLLEALPASEKVKAKDAAVRSSKALYRFLDGMDRYYPQAG